MGYSGPKGSQLLSFFYSSDGDGAKKKEWSTLVRQPNHLLAMLGGVSELFTFALCGALSSHLSSLREPYIHMRRETERKSENSPPRLSCFANSVVVKDQICNNPFLAKALNGNDTSKISRRFPHFFTEDYQDGVSASLLNIEIGSLEVLFHEAGEAAPVSYSCLDR